MVGSVEGSVAGGFRCPEGLEQRGRKIDAGTVCPSYGTMQGKGESCFCRLEKDARAGGWLFRVWRVDRDDQSPINELLIVSGCPVADAMADRPSSRTCPYK